MQLYFTRHGETDWNKERRLQGRTDIELNETGILQTQETAEKLKDAKIDLIISSPLKRALKTAEVINKFHKVKILTDERLIERNLGDFEGLIIDDVPELLSGESWGLDYVVPNGESLRDVYERVQNLINEIIDKYPDKNVLLVGHAGTFRPIKHFFEGAPEDGNLGNYSIKNCEVATYTIHAMGLQDVYFERIKNGSKTIELRLNDEKRQKIKVGDIARFKNSKNEFLATEVEDLLYYPNFEEMLSDQNLRALSGFETDIVEALEIMEEFYPRKKQDELGVVGIKIRLLQSMPE